MSEESKKQLTAEQHKRIEQVAIKLFAVIAGILILYFIFAPELSGDKEVNSGFNTTIPDAVQNEMAEDKKSAYQKEQLTKRDEDREAIKTLAEQLIEEDEERVEVIPPTSSGTSSRPNYHKREEPKDKIIASTEAYRDMNRTLESFYEEPKTKVDPEKEAMREELDELKEQLAMQEQIPQSMGVDEQIALMEKSYELAAKYMPNGQSVTSQPTTTITTPEIEKAKEYINGKAQLNTIGQVSKPVVSTLSQPMSDSTFVAEFSKSRNWGFNTAVGSGTKAERNTISAVIHSDQTITDGQSVRMRLTEDMSVGDRRLPKNAVITGMGKIQGERLFVSITALEHQGYILPVELTVVDSDGSEGIFIPSSMELNAIKEVAANLGSNMGTTINLNQQSAGDQILTDLGKGAIQGASQYIGKKMREVKVHLKAGYKVMLYQEKQ